MEVFFPAGGLAPPAIGLNWGGPLLHFDVARRTESDWALFRVACCTCEHSLAKRHTWAQILAAKAQRLRV